MARVPDRTYYLWTIGCQMNKADSSRLEDALVAQEYTPVAEPEQASLIILNTCVVRQSAENKVLGRMQSLRPLVEDGKGRSLIVMGCLVDNPTDLHRRFPFVSAFYAPSDIAGVMRYVIQHIPPAEMAVPENEPCARISEMVPISYGCDHHCTYCIVQLRRGNQRSRPVEAIRQDVQSLVSRGAREVTLLGQNVDAYGQDLPSKPDLADVLLAIHDIPQLLRIRFLTSHPRDLGQHVIDIAAALPKVCETWELPVQSGDDGVLRRMGRGYTVAHYRDLVSHIRAASPQSVINTDIIVGFPGETDEQFQHTLDLVRELQFDMVHVASYSPRPGTAAARWSDDVPVQVKEQRRLAVEALQTEVARKRSADEPGHTAEILVDGKQKGRWRGRTRTNHLVFFTDEGQWLGKLAQVRITWAGPWSMIGDVVTCDLH